MPLGPYGVDEYGHGQWEFPGCLRSFSARPGLQGPQVVLTWEAPVDPLQGVMIRRKVGECPRDAEDGVLVLQNIDNPNTLFNVTDLGDDLLALDAEPGEGRWWYYQAFVQPAPLPLNVQLAERAVAIILNVLRSTSAWDVQQTNGATIYMQPLWASPATVTVQVAPSDEGPWVDFDAAVVPFGEVATIFVPSAVNFVRAHLTDGAGARIWISEQNDRVWLTSSALSAAVYVYKTGRHMRAAMEGGLPELYWSRDGDQNTVPVFEVEGGDGEHLNLGATGEQRGHMWKLLSIYLEEFDRVDAYLGAIRRYVANIDEMPPQEFEHVAEMLGYPLEMDGRNWNDVREEIFRIAGVWKTKGTSRLTVALGSQIFGFIPRVQEGCGRVFRVADPDLYNLARIIENNQIGG